MTQQDPLEDLKRTIVLLYGMMDGGAPFWVFAAIRPSRYQQFLTAQKEGKVDLEQFAVYGELIISGEGKTPPDEVILKVAEMYQSDPAAFAKTVAEEPKA
ncbi:MAG: hypothetical protein EBV03_01640 [Proteobacteria bacterium]|nr:hypothetical protein [Pseudomonadota bacterium]